MVDYDGTDTFTGNVVTGNKLDTTSMWHGTTNPSNPTNEVPANGLFYNTSTKVLYHNTGTLASPTWTNISPAAAELGSITTATTTTPSAQTGTHEITMDATTLTGGNVAVKIDGTTEETVSAGTVSTRIYTPSSSISLVSTAGDISQSTYDSKSFVTTTQDSAMYDMYFKNDGTKMYTVGDATNKMYQYSLSTAWDVSTASYDSKSAALTGGSLPTSIALNDDGTKAYHLDWGNNRVYQYTLSTAWDISTATSASKNFYFHPDPTNGRDLEFNPDGTKMFLSSYSPTNTVWEYALSTAWDVTTASLTTEVNVQSDTHHSSSFTANGKNWIQFGNDSNDLFQYSLTTAYDLTTMTYDSKSYAQAEMTNSYGCVISPYNGNKMYLMDGGDKIWQYSISIGFGDAVNYKIL